MGDYMNEQNSTIEHEISLTMEIFKELKLQAKRWAIAFFIVLAMWFLTIGGFVWYLNQYDFASYEITSNDGGNANYIGNDGDIINGAGESTPKN